MKVVCNTRYRTYKDGGSKQWDVLNTKECGYTSVYQDNSISSKREGKSGLYYGQKNGNQTLLNVSDIEWASQYKPTKTMQIKPITPKQFKSAYGHGVTDTVIEVINELLIKSASYEGKKRVELTQPKVVDALVAKGIKREDIFDKGMLDFEPAFRNVGWKVTWNKGAYFEPDSASYWVFES